MILLLNKRQIRLIKKFTRSLIEESYRMIRQIHATSRNKYYKNFIENYYKFFY
ncbi:hypothetical protein NARC_190010 [Candidatus Nitrosocosmicus arcticus]|uniref:Uncharacterized protein n=1 Tax=Candidatus Nitrosocosmicus arcticus TaxID=2035267 RepID=A0A557SRE2_9ARCH|nr:hypothetical protein NARC_190010 [Candidatus Nitrosocosmicus arcticus]